MKLTKYWFEMDWGPEPVIENRYFRVTAWTFEDAVFLLETIIFKSGKLPPTNHVTDHIDVSTLDADHILPNVGVCTIRGIWYPQGY